MVLAVFAAGRRLAIRRCDLSFSQVYEARPRNVILIDVAPNIEVSPVVQPGDTRYLAPRNLESRWYNFGHAMLRLVARPYFWWNRRRKRLQGFSELCY